MTWKYITKDSNGIFEGVKVQQTYLKGWLKVFGVLEGQIEDSSQPLVKISVLLHETPVVTHKTLDTRWH